jgi:hypothetical protein
VKKDLMAAHLGSGMNDELGKGLPIKHQDELIGRNGKFISRITCHRRNNKSPVTADSDNDQFFDAGDDLNKELTSSNFVDQFNKLNEDFNKRVNDLDESGNKVVEDKVQSDEEFDAINIDSCH